MSEKQKLRFITEKNFIQYSTDYMDNVLLQMVKYQKCEQFIRCIEF